MSHYSSVPLIRKLKKRDSVSASGRGGEWKWSELSKKLFDDHLLFKLFKPSPATKLHTKSHSVSHNATTKKFFHIIIIILPAIQIAQLTVKRAWWQCSFFRGFLPVLLLLAAPTTSSSSVFLDGLLFLGKKSR